MTTLDDLRERLEAAEGPGRKLDEAIFEWHHGRKRKRSSFEQYDPSEVLPLYTASLDAAISLVEAKLPNWGWLLQGGGPPPAMASFVRPYMSFHEYQTQHKSEPIALLLALLSALEKESAE